MVFNHFLWESYVLWAWGAGATEGAFLQIRSLFSFVLFMALSKDLKNRACLLEMALHSSGLSKA